MATSQVGHFPHHIRRLELDKLEKSLSLEKQLAAYKLLPSCCQRLVDLPKDPDKS